MNLNQVKEILGAEVVTKSKDYDTDDFEYAFGSDLMSDVMAFVNRDVVLLTGLVTPQVVRTVEMMDISVIVFVRGKQPTESVIELAQTNDITIMKTELSMFESCGKLYEKGLRCKI